MYVIIVYDVEVQRINEVRKFLKTYLNWVQNSVFEGEVTESELERIKINLKEMINEHYDSILIYITRSQKAFKKTIIGQEKAPIDTIL